MSLTAQTEATLLLTGRFAKSEAKPLTSAELSRLVEWLGSKGRTLADLLETADGARALDDSSDFRSDRIDALLGRSAALGLQLERWQRAGLWIMTRFDADYPARLTTRLGTGNPAVFFGAGDRKLLSSGGVAMVGSRDASAEELDATRAIARTAAREGTSVVSGGARGVDEAAMLSALESGGTSIGVLADNLLRTATAAKYRAGLMERRLALISPYAPEAPFEVGNAMGRNRLIYCLSDAAIVIASSQGSGGTWAGATEAIKHRWVPVWALSSRSRDSGNSALVAAGAKWLPDPVQSVMSLGAPPAGVAEAPEAYLASTATKTMTLYEFFLERVQELLRSGPVKPADLEKQLELGKAQLSPWLKRAVAEKRLKKLSKPVRYAMPTEGQQPLPL